MTDPMNRFRPANYSGEQGVWNYQHPTGVQAAEARERTVASGGCGSWHPSRPNHWCTRRLRHHAEGMTEHICGWATWNGPFNDTRATVEPEGATGADRNVQPKEARRG